MTRQPVSTLSAIQPPLVFIGADTAQFSVALDQDPEAPVVVFAPDQVSARSLRALCASTGMDTADRVSVLVGPDYNGAAQVAARCAGLASARVVIDTVLEQRRPDDVLRAKAALSKLAFQGSANEGARRASAGRYLLQTLANAPRLAREADVLALSSLFTGIPAVVVAAGPSLDRNLRDLAAVADRVLIVACDTAARPLLTAGIDPHFVIAADSSRSNAAHLSSLPPSRAWLVSEGSLHPSAFTHFSGRTFIFRVADHHPWPWLQSAGVSATKLDTWGSVATCAYSLARMFDCGPVAFAGADFAFTHGRPYCRGTSFESQWALWHEQGSSYDDIWRLLRDRWASVTSEVGIDGEPVETAPHLLSFRDWIAERAAANANERVINASGAGLLTGDAIEQQTLAAAFGAAESIDRTLLDRVIAAAHQRSRGDMGRLIEAISGLADGDERVIHQWLEFSQGAASIAAITAALRSPEYLAWLIGRQSQGR